MKSSYEPLMDTQVIKEILPHRYPFLLVDRVVKVKEGPDHPNLKGLEVEAIKCVTINEPFFQGHFPHRPVMPGVLITEAMAQVGALAIAYVSESQQDFSLVGIDKCKFRAPVVPGDQLLIKILAEKQRQGLIWFNGEVSVDDQVVAQASLIAKAFPRKG